uniref:(northern house mosquito) hypothetical protein n=1 Tax=Culex pipiens TaxID=7175 RepID=A0A8D8AGN6_CULPI
MPTRSTARTRRSRRLPSVRRPAVGCSVRLGSRGTWAVDVRCASVAIRARASSARGDSSANRWRWSARTNRAHRCRLVAKLVRCRISAQRVNRWQSAELLGPSCAVTTPVSRPVHHCTAV